MITWTDDFVEKRRPRYFYSKILAMTDKWRDLKIAMFYKATLQITYILWLFPQKVRYSLNVCYFCVYVFLYMFLRIRISVYVFAYTLIRICCCFLSCCGVSTHKSLHSFVIASIFWSWYRGLLFRFIHALLCCNLETSRNWTDAFWLKQFAKESDHEYDGNFFLLLGWTRNFD